MPHYRYTGRDEGGARVAGAVEANSLDGAVGQLFERGVTPIEITEQADRGGGDLRHRLGLDRPGRDDIILFARQVYALTRSGVPLIRGLTRLAESTRNPVLQQAIREIIDDLESGRDFAGSLARHPRLFSPLFISMIRVGEASGRLEEAFGRMYEYLEREKETIQKIKTATRYPMFVVIAIAVAMWILMTWIIPVFAEVFGRFDAELPLATRGLIAVSGFFADWWPLMLAAVVGGVFAFRAWVRTDGGRYRWDRFKLRFPIIGDILLRATLARFARAFSMAYRSGVPILETMNVVSGAVDNRYISQHVQDMRAGIERGEELSRVAARAGVFTPLVLQMLAVGEETGRIDEMVDEVADFYEREVDHDVRNLSATIEPVLIVGIGVLIFLLALGVFLPMWDLGGAALGR